MANRTLAAPVTALRHGRPCDRQADPSRFRILQSTHLGGCRFAASLVVLPQRARYSRLEPSQVDDFLTCLEQGTPYLPAYRGNPSYDAPAQAAEIALLEWAGQHGITGEITLHKTESEISSPGQAHFQATIGTQRAAVTVERPEFAVNTRCVTIGECEGTKKRGALGRHTCSGAKSEHCSLRPKLILPQPSRTAEKNALTGG